MEGADWTAARGGGARTKAPSGFFSLALFARVARAQAPIAFFGTGTELLLDQILLPFAQTSRLRRGQMDQRFPHTAGQVAAQSSEDGFV